MKIMVVGVGAREHALAWALAEGGSALRVDIVPGNPGIMHPKIQVHPEAKEAFDRQDSKSLVAIAETLKADLVVVGPEDLLDLGLADELMKKGIPVLGPTKEASRLETSKSFAKKCLQKAKIPTCAYEVFEREDEFKALKEFIATGPFKGEMVIKADSLAKGKGVFVCDSPKEALEVVDTYFLQKGLSDKIVIEEKFTGKEISLFALCDGEAFLPLGSAADYKRLGDGDEGPNTGGMGAMSPAPWCDEKWEKKLHNEVTRPLLKLLKEEGILYRGFLFIGLMLRGDDYRVLEFNVRFGDPEAQTLLPTIKTDLAPWFLAASEGRLGEKMAKEKETISFHPYKAMHIVLAAKGYPGVDGPMAKNDEIFLGPGACGEFHRPYFAGVKKKGDSLYTSGGRVMGLSIWQHKKLPWEELRQKGYEHLKSMTFMGAHFRRDIAAQISEAKDDGHGQA